MIKNIIYTVYPENNKSLMSTLALQTWLGNNNNNNAENMTRFSRFQSIEPAREFATEH
jgi:hypothetical protein